MSDYIIGDVLLTWLYGVTMPNIAAGSTQYMQVEVSQLDSGLPTDPTGNDVYLAIVPGRATPGDDDWLTGSWDTSSVNGTYFAQVLIGPDGLLTLTPGVWTVWIKIDADPETPTAQAGTLTVY